MVWWDDKAIYLEQKFITFDKFVRATAMSKQCITNVNVFDVMKSFLGSEKPPTMPDELKLWLDSIEISSQKLRKEK